MKKRILFLYVITISVIIIISAITFYLDYNNEIKHVSNTVSQYMNNRKSTILSIYKYTGDKTKTIEIINDALKITLGKDKTSGEYVIAERRGDSIYFLSEHKKILEQKYIVLPISTNKALPMRLALKGDSGLVVGEDYIGENVYAAYTYIPELDWGLVVKIDKSEIWISIYHTAIIILLIAIVFSFISTYIIYKISLPIDKEIRDNEKKFSKAVNNSPFPIMIHAEDGKVLNLSKGWTDITGYTLSDIPTIEKWTLLAYGENKNNIKEYINSLYELNDSVDEGEYTITCNNGEKRIWDFSSAPIGKLNDGRRAVISIAKDITERKDLEIKLKSQKEEIESQNEEIHQQNDEYRQINEEYKQINNELILSKFKIEESEARFRSTFDQSSVGAAMVGLDKVFLNCNSAFCNFLGYEKDEIIGKSILDITYNEDIDIGIKELKLIAEGKIDSFTTQKRYVRKDGKIVWGEVSISVVRDLNNKALYFLPIIQNITERKSDELLIKEKTEEIENQNEEYKQINEEYKQINEELFISRQKAEESDRLKSAFLANMSHEIRTPMNGIIGFADLLRNPELTEKKQKEYTSIIIERSHQLLSVVSDILDISKIEAGLVTVKNESVSINELITELWSCYSNHQKMKDIKLVKKLGLDGLDNFISADKTKITQVLNNLLNNAMKFTNHGQIVFGYELKKDFLEFFVEDTGIGIPDNYKDKMFERFRQVEEQMTKNYGGTGLGLAISKELVEMMGGEIWLESKESVGTKVSFTIPYMPLSAEDQITLEPKVNNLEKIIAGKSVLIVDDDEINLLYIKELLTEYDLKLYEAINGVEAVEQFRNNRDVSIVLMDIKMPIMNGVEAAKLIKSLDSKVKIIAQTAYAMYSEKEMVLNEGCDDYISKPIKKEELLDLLKKYL